MMAIQIREYKHPVDYPEVWRLWENMEVGIRLGRSDTPEEIQKKIDHNPELFLLAEIDPQLVGTLMGGFDGRRGLIYHLAVTPLFRKQGIGSMLMNEMENRLKSHGCLKCHLMVTKDNVEAMRYYELRGWERMDSIHVYGKEFA